MDRAGLWVVGVGAALVAAFHVVGLVLAARQTFGDEPLEVTGVTLGVGAMPSLTERVPAVVDASYDSLTLVVESVPALARWLLWGAEATRSLAAIGVCLALVWLCVRVWRRRPFGRSLTVALVVTGSLVIVGGMLPQLLAGMGRAEVVDHLGARALADALGDGTVTTFAVELSLAPVGIGLALGVVAAAFEIGERLQRDAEGLV